MKILSSGLFTAAVLLVAVFLAWRASRWKAQTDAVTIPRSALEVEKKTVGGLSIGQSIIIYHIAIGKDLKAFIYPHEQEHEKCAKYMPCFRVTRVDKGMEVIRLTAEKEDIVSSVDTFEVTEALPVLKYSESPSIQPAIIQKSVGDCASNVIASGSVNINCDSGGVKK